MEQTDYNMSATEVLYILEYLPKDTVAKIPQKFINFLKQHSIQNYNPNFDFSHGLDKLELKPKTKALLSMIYRNYICSESEKIEYDKILYQNEKDYQNSLRNIYNPDNIFKNKKTANEKTIQLIEYKKPKWYVKIFQKIFNLFNHDPQ